MNRWERDDDRESGAGDRRPRRSDGGCSDRSSTVESEPGRPRPQLTRRGSDDPSFLAAALAAGRACGVTRIADLTGLDRPGLPVWQAVRPAGRALSVHQGKGATALAARIGALCEAIESHSAESVEADGPRAAWDALDAGDPADFATDRNRPPERGDAVAWCSAEDAPSGKAAWLPHPFVSLDYTSGLPSRFERSSAGLGAGPDFDPALGQSLLELIERDAVGEWRRSADRAKAEMVRASIPYPWFGEWSERLESLAIDLRVFALPSLTGIPVIFCLIGGREEFGRGYRSFHGSAAAGDSAQALFKALAEALQSRLTFIAATRDDFLPSHYAKWKEATAAPPPARRTWESAEPVDDGWRAVSARLAERGFERLLVKRLGGGLEGVAVTKAFVPGLGSLTRTRRAP